ncbi:AAA family ATPase [Pseudoalteromonas sp. P1-8]|uniref:AAA family ATPase n=1 Tax=Pseudoalteromonas sp. P1-8 TaxID=1710353 RepID=UPI0006DBFD0E|nr:AAA family ATPase [Pseudoalteromonas sp. P1-8]KPV99237.1 DNA replication and repair protein RecF [Pseudoalteromonas sp. P1-8]
MGNYRIGRLLVKNFKSYTEEFSYNFENKDLIILDGPNGFGKTTIFDAIEIAFTGTVSRFKDSKIIDTKQRNKNMLISTNGVDGAPAFVVLELISNNNSLIIGTYIEAKKGKNKEWANHIYRGILKSWPDNIDDIYIEIGEGNGNIIEELQEALNFKELNKMFTVFNYIQQEETLHFLKLDEKSRFKQIDHLFGIGDEKNAFEKLEKLKNLVLAKITDLETKKSDKKAEREELRTEESAYDEISLSGNTIEQLGTKTIAELEKYKAALEECKKILSDGGGNAWSLIKQRYAVKKQLEAENKNAIKNLLLFSNIADSKHVGYNRIESLSKHILWITKTVEKCADYSELKNLDITKEIEITDVLLNKIQKHFKKLYEVNKANINSYETLVNTQSTTEKLLTSITNSSETLIKKLNKYCNEEEEFIENSDNKEGIDCPLCGQPYDDLIELNKAYKEQKIAFEKLQTDSSKKLELAYNKLIDELISPSIQRSKDRFAKYSHFNDNYKEILRTRQVSRDQFDEIIKLKSWFDENLPQYSEHACPSLFSADYSVEEKYTEIKTLLETLDSKLSVKVGDEFEPIKAKLDDIGVDASTEVNDWPFSLENVINDIQYLENQIKLLNNNQYSKLTDEITEYDTGISNYKNILNALNDGHKIYKTNITRYEKEIAKKIQIPFYNISSKILQTRLESGMPASGVILEAPDKLNNNGYYRFCSSIGSEHDAWSTMSSGQLAGVIIAFMLAMNKVFPTGLKTLLIDDPIQSMDDINMASFIQLLREEFKGYQIIMSTHESRIANYVSYKYQTSGLSPLAINLKNDKKNRDLI